MVIKEGEKGRASKAEPTAEFEFLDAWEMVVRLLK
jgi:hypothetical protein